MKPAARRLRDWCLSDGPLLVILGAAITLRGVSYLVGGLTEHPAERLLPLGAWAVVWVVVGGGLLGTSVKPSTFPAAVALGFGVALHLLWGLSFLLASMERPGYDRAWVTSVGFGSVAFITLWLTWRTRALERLKPRLPTKELEDALGRH
ncbi:hypothetical protein [Corynebacterium uterequi]|nr:hypothetical protein [Corynebacterium uterequi]